MKILVFLSIVLFIFNTSAQGEEYWERGELSGEELAEALSNPRRFHFNDGGNIDFQNGFFKRRINFAGRPQVCHDGTYIYGGTGKKCVLNIEKKVCAKKVTVDLMAKMEGTHIVCNDIGNSENTDCKHPSYMKFNYGPDVKVKVYRKVGGKTKGRYLGYAIIEIPRCDSF